MPAPYVKRAMRSRASAAMLGAAYNALWYPALPFVLMATASTAAGRRERLGLARAELGSGRFRLWAHAASVGEIEAVRGIVASLRREFPFIAAPVVTAMTAAGRDAARRRIPEAISLLAPFDCRNTVRNFLAAVRPNLVLIAETEIWPNFFLQSARAGAKIAIINGRLSERAMRRYHLARPLFANVLEQADLILAQTDDDARRYRSLGAPPDRLAVTGNTKFAVDPGASVLRPALERFLAGRRILIAGSTAPGEERLVLTAYGHLRERFPGLSLIIAPRHLNRVSEIEEDLRSSSFNYVKASALEQPTEAVGTDAVLLLDTMGELRALYRGGAAAFVGGSMHPPRGGQNLAEPAAVATPVLFGPYYQNQQKTGDALIAGGGGRVIADAGELESACAEWLGDDDARAQAGQNARRVIERMTGGTAATVEYLRKLIGTA
ncbi:MAG: 3-deoxy-D-manno-octulosonic acid transferase [Candidatus Binataceae bacterium]